MQKICDGCGGKRPRFTVGTKETRKGEGSQPRTRYCNSCARERVGRS